MDQRFVGNPPRGGALGQVLSPDGSNAAVAALAGRWHQPAPGLNDDITWTLDKSGTLTIRRVPKKGKPEDVVRQLEILRERQFAIKQGTSMQFAPFFVDGKKLYLSWTRGPTAITVANEAGPAPDLARRTNPPRGVGGRHARLSAAHGTNGAE